jgi:hypothetical protein
VALQKICSSGSSSKKSASRHSARKQGESPAFDATAIHAGRQDTPCRKLHEICQ